MKTERKRNRWGKLYTGLCAFFIVGEIMLVLFSWLLSATMQEGVRSLMSAEGLRWFLGGFTTMLASPKLIWLLLFAMAGGCVWKSGLLTLSFRSLLWGFRQRVALMTSLLILIIYIAVVMMLTAVPHAALLSATGQLFPSPFSRALVPLFTFGVMLTAVAYGWASGHYKSLTDVVSSWSWGVGWAAPLLVLYVLFVQFELSLRFVFT